MQRSKNPSFDHLVGNGQQCWGHREAQRPRGLEVDDQFVFGGLFHRQICGFGTLEDFSNVEGGAPN
jgi:hypothetical protein